MAPDEAYAVHWDVPLSPGSNELQITAGDGAGTDRTTIELVALDVDTDGPFPDAGIAIDVGSHREIVTEDALYAPDRSYGDSDLGWGALGGDHVETLDRIVETDLDPLYQHAREGLDAYRLDVPPGTYSIELAVCDFEHESAGERVFSVRANGETIASDLDPVSAAGPRTPVTVTATVTVHSDGGLRIAFDADTGASLLNALRVERSGPVLDRD